MSRYSLLRGVLLTSGLTGRHFKELGDPTAVIHHLIFAYMTAYVLAHSIMAFPFVWLAFCEISTPSVNLRCAHSLPYIAACGCSQHKLAPCAWSTTVLLQHSTGVVHCVDKAELLCVCRP